MSRADSLTGSPGPSRSLDGSSKSKRALPAFDLEAKLRDAVVQSQLAASLRSEEPAGTPAARLMPQRIPRDLTNTLESLWNSSQGVHIPNLPPPTTTFPKRPRGGSPASAGQGAVGGGSPQTPSPTNSGGGSTAGSQHSGGRNQPAVSTGQVLSSPTGSSPLGAPHHPYAPRPAASEASSRSHSSVGSAGRDLFSGPGRFRPPPVDDETMEGLSVEEWLGRVQGAQPVQLGAEYLEEDFYRGLDELSRAFNEFESLMAPEFRTPWGAQGGGRLNMRGAGDPGVTPEQLEQQHLLLLQRQGHRQPQQGAGAEAGGGAHMAAKLQLAATSLKQQQQQQGVPGAHQQQQAGRGAGQSPTAQQQQQRDEEQMLLLLQEQQKQLQQGFPGQATQKQQQQILRGLEALQGVPGAHQPGLEALQGAPSEQQVQQLLALQNQAQALAVLRALPEQQQRQLALELLQRQQAQSLAQQQQLEHLQREQQQQQEQQRQVQEQQKQMQLLQKQQQQAHRRDEQVCLPPELALQPGSEARTNGAVEAQGPQAGVPGKMPSSGEVIALLVEIAKAIVANEHAKVKGLLGKLSSVASLYGNSTQRMSAYFLEGLLSRISGGPRTGSAASVEFQYCSFDCGAPLLRAFEVLVSSSPYLAFGHVASNSAILEAVQDCDRIHIVDFGLGHAVQWPALIQAFATRPGGPPHLTLSGIDRPYVAGVHKGYCLRQAGQRLKAIAKEWNLPFSFNVLPVYLPELRPDMVKIQEGETVVVNCSLRLHSLMDESVTPSNPRQAVLRTMRALNPRLCTLVEQATNHNSPFFLSRFLEALHYYSILFDSLDESVPPNVQERKVFEQQVLGRAIVNVVACEGQDRTERQEPLGQWQRRVERAGFLPCPLSDGVVSTASALLSMYEKKSYSIAVEPSNSLVLHWKDKPLLAMSAWVPNPYEGASRDT